MLACLDGCSTSRLRSNSNPPNLSISIEMHCRVGWAPSLHSWRQQTRRQRPGAPASGRRSARRCPSSASSSSPSLRPWPRRWTPSLPRFLPHCLLPFTDTHHHTMFLLAYTALSMWCETVIWIRQFSSTIGDLRCQLKWSYSSKQAFACVPYVYTAWLVDALPFNKPSLASVCHTPCQRLLACLAKCEEHRFNAQFEATKTIWTLVLTYRTGPMWWQ